MTKLVDLEPAWVTGAYERAGVLYSDRDPESEDGRRFLELNPQYGSVDPLFPRGRHGMGLIFCCPMHRPRVETCDLETCDFEHLFVPFENPTDGGPRCLKGQGKDGTAFWVRTGDTFEVLSLTPSILVPAEGPEHWHGFITNGEVHT
jgi:hypothetical protein